MLTNLDTRTIHCITFQSQKNPENFLNWGLIFLKPCAIICKSCGAQENIRVWRSLVSRLNGVQEASSSNLDTRTKKS